MPRPFSEMYKKKCKMLRDKYKNVHNKYLILVVNN